VGDLGIHLLGPPSVSRNGEEAPPPRGRKAWALLAHLLTQRRPVPRERLAALLFADADDPLGALRWNLSELRRLLGLPGALRGSPVALALPPGTFVDVHAVLSGDWADAARAPGLGRDLLEGMDFPSSPSFDVWLTNERRHLQAASEAVLAEAARASLAASAPDAAADHAARLVAIDPFNEHAQAILIRAFAAAGDVDSAERQHDAFDALLRRELGRAAGPGVRAVAPGPAPGDVSTGAHARAQLEAGEAALRAGAVDTGIGCVREAVAAAGAGGDDALQARALLALALARFDTGRGAEDEIVVDLHRAILLADRSDRRETAARGRLALAYVDELAGRYARAERWLAAASGAFDPRVEDEIGLALGRCRIDRGEYDAADAVLEAVVASARARGAADVAVWARNQLGRLALERGDLDRAEPLLRAVAGDAHALGLTGWLPLPLGLHGRALVERGEVEAARAPLERGLVLATHAGDPCWLALTLTGLALLADREGDAGAAMSALREARRHVVRGPAPSAYLLAWVTDAYCRVAIAAGSARARHAVGELETLAARAGMRDLLARAHLHRHALGDPDALAAARIVAADVDSPGLERAIEAAVAAPARPPVRRAA